MAAKLTPLPVMKAEAFLDGSRQTHSHTIITHTHLFIFNSPFYKRIQCIFFPKTCVLIVGNPPVHNTKDNDGCLTFQTASRK